MIESKLVASKSTTPGLRGKVSVSTKGLSKVRPYKKLSSGKKRSSGRDNHGHISTRHKGGGAKRLYREIAFKRTVKNVEGTVETIEYDPNRTAFIALVDYNGGVKQYIIAADGLNVGDKVTSSPDAGHSVGSSMPLRNIPIGSLIYNIELKPGAKAKIARSAGVSASLLSKEADHVKVKLPSGDIKEFHLDCYASIGSVSNPLKKNEKIGKAGRNRWKGMRPTVRGTAMNPVDHPHGGGEGKKAGGGSSGKHPVTPWGKKTKGLKTRKSKRDKQKKK
jgi:large subunit ribosomal protein L2